jgi:hypothetical protein
MMIASEKVEKPVMLTHGRLVFICNIEWFYGTIELLWFLSLLSIKKKQ